METLDEFDEDIEIKGKNEITIMILKIEIYMIKGQIYHHNEELVIANQFYQLAVGICNLVLEEIPSKSDSFPIESLNLFHLSSLLRFLYDCLSKLDNEENIAPSVFWFDKFV